MKSIFTYVTYIRTTPEKLFEALTKPEFTKSYWAGTWQESEWKKGASWKILKSDGSLADSGEILEIDPPRLLKVSWRNEFVPGLKEEGYSRCTFEIEPTEDCARLTITHEIDVGDSLFIKAVSGGWPAILASLKTLLETGNALEITKRWGSKK
jgi:uncharacterized protein YndB with AHSA1/START domain